MSDTVEIREAALGDSAALAELFDAYRIFYSQKSDVEAARAFIHERMTGKSSQFFAAICEKKLCGFVQLYPSFSSISMKPLWILNDLFVDPNYRRRQIAEKLLLRAEKFARDSGARGLTLKTALSNEAAQKLYLKLGWVLDEKFLTFNRSILSQ